MALTEIPPPAATVEPSATESIDGAATAEPRATDSAGGAATAEPTTAASPEGTGLEVAMVFEEELASKEDAPLTGWRASAIDARADCAARRGRANARGDTDAVHDVLRLSAQRSKHSYTGFEAQVIGLLAREVEVVFLDGPSGG